MAAAGSRDTVTLLSGTFGEVWKTIHKFHLGAISVVPRHKWYLAQWPQRTAAPKPGKNREEPSCFCPALGDGSLHRREPRAVEELFYP